MNQPQFPQNTCARGRQGRQGGTGKLAASAASASWLDRLARLGLRFSRTVSRPRPRQPRPMTGAPRPRLRPHRSVPPSRASPTSRGRVTGASRRRQSRPCRFCGGSRRPCRATGASRSRELGPSSTRPSDEARTFAPHPRLQSPNRGARACARHASQAPPSVRTSSHDG